MGGNSAPSSLRALVVDDAALYRKVLAGILAEMPGVEVVGTASGGRMGLERMAALRPDFITLDIEMPDLTGVEVLQAMQSLGLDAGVVVVAAPTLGGGRATVRALELGALDFVTKPEGCGQEACRQLRERLARVVGEFARRKGIRAALGPAARVSPPNPPRPPAAAVDEPAARPAAPLTKPGMVLIGASTGGPQALATVLARIPGDLGVPLFVVQHMPPLFTQALAASLDGKCSVRVAEAREAEVAAPNRVYLAPGGKQMKLAAGPGGQVVVRITDDPPENNCRPSADCLFRSAALYFPGEALAVVLTGMGNDGALGVRLLKRGGSRTVAQDEASCVVFGMPKEAIATGMVDVIAPLDTIAGEIVRAVRGNAA